MSKLYQKINGSAVPLSGGVGVINNLNSTSTTDALSANMGKELNDELAVVSLSVNQKWQGNGYNLIPYPYYDGSSKEVSGITFTVSNDGSISASGTATSDVTFTLQFRTGGKIPYGEGTKVRLSGCPLNGSNTTYALGINGTAADSSFIAIGEDYGEGYITTIPDGVVQLGVYIRIYNGTTVSNLVFKPMLTIVNANDKYPTEYQRYAMGNVEMTDKISSLQRDGLVVHQYTIPVTSKSIAANSVTDIRFEAPTPIPNYRHVALLNVVATTQAAGGQGHLNWPTIIYPHQINGEVVVYIASLVSHSVDQILVFYLDERLD